MRILFDRFVEAGASRVDPALRGKGVGAGSMVRLIRDIQEKGVSPQRSPCGPTRSI